MERAEKIGLGIASAAHVLLFAALSSRWLGTPAPLKLNNAPIEVSIADEVALESAARKLSSAPPPPTPGEVEGPPEQATTAPAEAVAEPRPTPRPEPSPTPVPRPKPEPKKIEKPTPPGPKLVEKLKPPKKETPKKEPPKTAQKEQPKTTTAPAPANTPFGETVLENANFPYSYYIEQMLNKIDQAWENPVRSDLPLSTVIYFRIQKDGNREDLRSW